MGRLTNLSSAALLEADLAMPWGMSGGSVLTDDESVCAVVTLALNLVFTFVLPGVAEREVETS
jgi:hypothetical protein